MYVNICMISQNVCHTCLHICHASVYTRSKTQTLRHTISAIFLELNCCLSQCLFPKPKELPYYRQIKIEVNAMKWFYYKESRKLSAVRVQQQMSVETNTAVSTLIKWDAAG